MRKLGICIYMDKDKKTYFTRNGRYFDTPSDWTVT